MIGDSVTSIGDSAFSSCDSLESVVIGDSVTSIGDEAFKYCDSLESVVIGDSVTSIGDSAFYYCSSLVSVTIPDSVTSIGSFAFYGTAYYNDKNNWVDGVLYIGNHLINAKDTISGKYVVRDGTLAIANYAFKYCDSLESVVIGDSVTSIGDSAFEYCSSLESVVIGDSVTSIGSWAFAYCSSLTEVYYNGSAAEWNHISIYSTNDSLKNATRYYYSENQPTEEGNFWHYVDGVPTIWE